MDGRYQLCAPDLYLCYRKKQCPILSYAKRGAFRNLARASDPYNSSRKGVLGRIGWTNCLANLAYRSSWSGLQMNSRLADYLSRLGEQLEVGKDADTEQ